MPTSLAGKRSKAEAGTRKLEAGRRGVTLMEMLIVVTLIALLVGISFPALSSGIDTLRLNAATRSVVAFINGGLSRAERRQQVVEVSISKAENALTLRSSEPGFSRRLDLPAGIQIESILPEVPDEDPEAARSFLLYPGGTVPGFGVMIADSKHSERIVRVDPITGVPRVEDLATQK